MLGSRLTKASLKSLSDPVVVRFGRAPVGEAVEVEVEGVVAGEQQVDWSCEPSHPQLIRAPKSLVSLFVRIKPDVDSCNGYIEDNEACEDHNLERGFGHRMTYQQNRHSCLLLLSHRFQFINLCLLSMVVSIGRSFCGDLHDLRWSGAVCSTFAMVATSVLLENWWGALAFLRALLARVSLSLVMITMFMQNMLAIGKTFMMPMLMILYVIQNPLKSWKILV